MLNSDALRRLVAVALLVAALVVLPCAPVLAAGEGSEEAQGTSESDDQGLIEELIQWIEGLLGGQETDARQAMDPNG